jgi:hypothetical protein
MKLLLTSHLIPIRSQFLFITLFSDTSVYVSHPQRTTGKIIVSHVAVFKILERMLEKGDRLCGLVVRVLGYRSGGRGSIPGTTRKKKEWWVWNGVHSAS